MLKQIRISSRKTKLLAKLLIVLLVLVSSGLGFNYAKAAQLTSISDTLTRQKASTLADHTIFFVTPAGINASTQTIAIVFNSFTMGTFALLNFDLASGNSGTCSSATYTEKTLATTAAANTWGVAQASQTVTFTAPTNATTGEIGAGNCARIRIGSNAVTGGAGTTQLTNPAATGAQVDFTVAGPTTDTGSIFVVTLSNDQVTLDATVNPTLSFTLAQNTLHFGTLTTANGRWATTTTGTGTETTSTADLAAATNATSGYVIAAIGDTLKSGANSITAVGGSPTASAPGTSQFGLRLVGSGSGSGTPVSPYNGSAGNYGESFTASTSATIASAAGPTLTNTYQQFFLANIAANTAAGFYATTITYTCTGTF